MDQGNDATGVVSSIKVAHNPADFIYNIISDRAVQTKSALQLQLYDSVAMLDGTISLKGKADDIIYQKALSDLVDTIGLEANAKLINLKGKEYEEVANRIMPKLVAASRFLAKGFMSGAPIVVRFHNDGDGSAGAIALYRAFAELQKRFFTGERGVSWEMNRSIAYTLESFYADKMRFQSYESIERPIVVITDFGTSEESIEALNGSAEVCDIVWLDHHMPYDGFPRESVKHYINVCDFGGESSFTAGLLTCMFAQVLAAVDVEDVKSAALVSDYSKYADFKSEAAAMHSIILDYLTSSSNEMHNKPKYMDAVLRDSEKSESVFRHANGILEETIDTGIKNVRSYRNAEGINICVLDFAHIAKLRLDYPLPGRYSSKLQYRMESVNGGRTVTLVHYGSYISVRTSEDVRGSIDLLEIIEKLKASSNGAIAGGGHKQAASIRTERGRIDEAIRLFLMELGVQAD
jgi:RecJ-like exonuclease